MSGPAYTDDAIGALKVAARTEHDFAGWLAAVLSTVAAEHGSSGALTAGRPGSWEASLVDQLVKGTVGHDDEHLAAYVRRAQAPVSMTDDDLRADAPITPTGRRSPVEPSCQPDDLAQLREQFPDWDIEARWTVAGTGPDQRYLLAQKDDLTVTAWTTGDRSAWLVFQDESGVSLVPPVRATWAPRGQTPVLRHRFNRKRLSMSGALAYRPGGSGAALVFQIKEGSYTTESLIGFLEDLHEHLGAAPVTLIWDGLPAHRSVAMKTWITAQHRWLQVERLPGYAHDLNPVEMVWGNVKAVELANLCADTIDQARAAAEAGLKRSAPARSFASPSFTTPGFPYDHGSPDYRKVFKLARGTTPGTPAGLKSAASLLACTVLRRPTAARWPELSAA